MRSGSTSGSRATKLTESHTVFIQPTQGLLKQPRLRVTRRHRSLNNVELVFVQINAGEGAGFIGVVGQLQLISFHQVYGIPHKARQLGVALHQFP